MKKDSLEQPRSGIRVCRPGGPSVRLDWLLSRDSRGVRTLWREKDRTGATDRRFLALDGLRLAHSLVMAKQGTDALYATSHLVRKDAKEAKQDAFYYCRRSLADYRTDDSFRRLQTAIVAPPQEDGDPWILADDIYNTGIVAELKPGWPCDDQSLTGCERTLTLAEALHPASWGRLVKRLDLLVQ